MTSFYSLQNRFRYRVSMAAVIMLCLVMSGAVMAETQSPPFSEPKAPIETATAKSENKAKAPAKKAGQDKIAMESDKAVINRTDRIIELNGNVKVSQGDTIITSDKLKLFLKEGASVDQPGASGESSIDKVIADGNVKFQLDIGTAYSDRAEYVSQTRLLTLTGKEPKFISGKNTITGSKITVNRDTGVVTFEGGNTRVEAVIYSKEKL